MKLQQQNKIVFLLTCMMVLLLSAMSGGVVAKEVYSWTDENGVVHYGETPPDGQKAQIINIRASQRPGTSEADPGPGDTRAETASDAAIEDDADGQEAGPPPSAAEARREKMARDRKQRRDTQAEMDRMCAQHRERLASVEPHRRVFYTNENGETVRMNDDERIALVEESKDFIAKNCDD